LHKSVLKCVQTISYSRLYCPNEEARTQSTIVWCAFKDFKETLKVLIDSVNRASV
jgi:hypothetical protein